MTIPPAGGVKAWPCLARGGVVDRVREDWCCDSHAGEARSRAGGALSSGGQMPVGAATAPKARGDKDGVDRCRRTGVDAAPAAHRRGLMSAAPPRERTEPSPTGTGGGKILSASGSSRRGVDPPPRRTSLTAGEVSGHTPLAASREELAEDAVAAESWARKHWLAEVALLGEDGACIDDGSPTGSLVTNGVPRGEAEGPGSRSSSASDLSQIFKQPAADSGWTSAGTPEIVLPAAGELADARR